ncbi:MAG: hypothetical protein H0V17_02325 [Deltaproteobacteria bacterium]|nr:hypothetical protein [Deltaproteobacteria bacterium]
MVTWWKNLLMWWRARRLFDRGRENTVFVHLWRGEHDAARRMLEAADHPTNAFQLACLELELGNFDVAERWALRLPASDPLRTVVLELIGRRSAVPGAFRGASASWLSSLEAAWDAAGRPDLRNHAALSADFQKSIDVGDATALVGSDRMAWLCMTQTQGWLPRRRPADARAWAAEAVDRSVPELVIAFHNLTGWFEPAKTKVDATRVIDALAVQAPRDLFVQLMRFAIRKPPFVETTVAELEAILEACVVDGSVQQLVYDRFEHVARLAGSKSAGPLAFAGWCVTLLLPDLAYLFKLFDATTGALQPRIAETYLRLGRRIHEDGSLIGFLFGTTLIRRAATVLDRQDLFDELARYEEEVRHYVPVSNHLRLDPQMWPIPTLNCEYLERCRLGERAHFRDMLRRQGVLKA